MNAMEKLIGELLNIERVACRAMEKWDGVDIAKVPKEFHGYRDIFAKVDGIITHLSQITPSNDEGKEPDHAGMQKDFELAHKATAADRAMPIAIVTDNNTCHKTSEWSNLVKTNPNITLDVGTKLYLHKLTVDLYQNNGKWFTKITGQLEWMVWETETYAEAEAKAREYLSGLNDKENEK